MKRDKVKIKPGDASETAKCLWGRSVALVMAFLLCLQSAGSAAAMGCAGLASFERTAVGGRAAEQALAPRLETFYRSEEGLNTPAVLSVLRPLRSGGITEVYEAYDPSQKKIVILKFPGTESDSVKMFRREATFYSRLDGHLRRAVRTRFPEVLESGKWGNSEYLSFGLLPGASLETVLEDYPLGMPFEDAADILRQILILIGALHRADVIHEDLKPSNILLDKVGGKWNVSILDLGFAVDLFRPKDDPFGGSAGFIAPERIANLNARPSDDLYAAGVLFAELLTGSNPNRIIQNQLLNEEWKKQAAMFEDDTSSLLFIWQQNEIFLNMVRFSSFSDAIKDFILTACASQWANRFLSAQTMLTALKSVIASGPMKSHSGNSGDAQREIRQSLTKVEKLRELTLELLSWNTSGGALGVVIQRSFMMAATFASSHWHHLDLSTLTLRVVTIPAAIELLPYSPENEMWWIEVLRELFVNAIDSMARSDTKEIVIAANRVQDEVQLHIQDTGHGISREAYERLGSPAYSKKPDGFPGTGGGLWNLMGLLNGMGELQVRSIVGRGTTFTLVFKVNMTKAA